MSDFNTISTAQKTLDPYKRVKYSMGLVLGVDEFEQEQTYFLGRNRLHNRALHGYGTICGLDITIDGDSVRVTSGLAVDPQGREIRVTPDQCASINDWLEKNQEAVENRYGPLLGSPPYSLPLYIVLCYLECETDSVPIPGAPCRSQEETMAPSRITESFELKLSLDPPAQVEEEAVGRFGELLDRIEITSEPGVFVTREEMEELVRGLTDETGSPPDPNSPPVSETLRLHPGEARDILGAAFRVWVTEVRPALLGDGTNCLTGPPDELCILLGQLDFDVVEVGGKLQVSGDITVNEDNRPILLHTRLLQEWLLCGRLGHTVSMGTARTFATLFLQDSSTIRAWVHHPVLLNFLNDAVTIEVNDVEIDSFTVTQMVETNVFDLGGINAPLTNGDRVTVSFDSSKINEATSLPRSLLSAMEELDYSYIDRDEDDLLAYLGVDLTVLDGVISHHDLVDSDEGDDHPQYLLTDGTRDLTGPQSAGENKITHLAEATENGDALRYGQAAEGDLGETYPNPIVTKLQRRSVGDIDPADGQVLTWNSDGEGQWEPQEPQAGDGNFVEAPNGPYAIVAAGFFRIVKDVDQYGAPYYDVTNIGPVYNSLEVRPLKELGEFNLWFPDYQDPTANEGFMYIVKGTIQEENSTARTTFQVVRFYGQATGIRVQILDINERYLHYRPFGLMVEISKIGPPPPV